MKKTIFGTALLAVIFLASCAGGETKTEESGEVAAAGTEAKTFAIDNSASKVAWLAKKVTGEHNGTVAIKSGDLKVENGNVSAGKFVLDMSTITVLDLEDPEYNAKLTGHLKSPDFFAVETSPESVFEIVSVEAIPGAAAGQPNYNVKGNLTIKGISKAITFPATINVEENAVSAQAEFAVDRTAWDIQYGSGKFFQDLGDKMIYDDFTINFSIVAKA
ncbi:MAG: YceI family protein [Bacteroidetes bacterium]|nr:YceI family protein [Bacteroidota bacterium]